METTYSPPGIGDNNGCAAAASLLDKSSRRMEDDLGTVTSPMVDALRSSLAYFLERIGNMVIYRECRFFDVGGEGRGDVGGEDRSPTEGTDEDDDDHDADDGGGSRSSSEEFFSKRIYHSEFRRMFIL